MNTNHGDAENRRKIEPSRRQYVPSQTTNSEAHQHKRIQSHGGSTDNVRTVPHYRGEDTKSGLRSREQRGDGQDKLYGSCNRSSGHNRPCHGYCQQQPRLGEIKPSLAVAVLLFQGRDPKGPATPHPYTRGIARVIAAFAPPTTYLVTGVPPATTDTAGSASFDISRGVLASPATFIIIQFCPWGRVDRPIPVTAPSPAAGQSRCWTVSPGPSPHRRPWAARSHRYPLARPGGSIYSLSNSTYLAVVVIPRAASIAVGSDISSGGAVCPIEPLQSPCGPPRWMPAVPSHCTCRG